MRNLLRCKLFWLAFTLGTLSMLILSLYQLGWLSYLFYDLETARQIPVTSFDVLFAIVISLLVGFNLGGFLYLNRTQKKSCRPNQVGWLGTIGAALGAFSLICFACNLAFLATFGVALNIFWLVPYLPMLRFISLILLVIAAYFIVRKVRNPSCQIGTIKK